MAVGRALTGRVPARPALRRAAILALVLAGVLLEYAPRPYTTTRFVVPSFYTELAREPDAPFRRLDKDRPGRFNRLARSGSVGPVSRSPSPLPLGAGRKDHGHLRASGRR